MSRSGPARSEQGFALVTVLMLTALLVSLLAACFFVTQVQMRVTRSSMDSSIGFYAAEAGLNIRAEAVRSRFLGYNRPSGVTPALTPGVLPCEPGGDLGSGDFACESHTFERRDVRTYVEEDAGNPVAVVLPPGTPYQYLSAQEYNFDVTSVALYREQPEAILGMRFKSVLVPLFQFAAFYNKDLEILPGPTMHLGGPVYSGGNLFLDSGATLTIQGQVTTAGGLYRGRKDVDSCTGGLVRIFDASTTPVSLPPCNGTRVSISENAVTNDPPIGYHDWQGWIRTGVDPLEVPPPESRDPTPGQIYWDKAELRVVMDMVDDRIKVLNPDLSEDVANTPLLLSCPDVVSRTRTTDPVYFYNFREGTRIEMLNVHVQKMIDCIETHPSLIDHRGLDDDTEGGLIWFLTVMGPNENGINHYGVRLHHGRDLEPTAGTGQIHGLTVVSNQAVYIQGDYNSGASWHPAAVMADSLNVLSNAWNDANSQQSLESNRRDASATTIFAAFLSGTDTSGGPNGEGDLNSGVYNGGVENYPRLHEDWAGVALTYRGSFVSLEQPRHVDGAWGSQSYNAPIRNWGYDTRFNDAANLPPLTPRFVFLRQHLFVREFDY